VKYEKYALVAIVDQIRGLQADLASLFFALYLTEYSFSLYHLS